MDCILPGSSVHGIFQARILEWIPIYFSQGSSQCRNWTSTFCLAGGFFTIEPPGNEQHFNNESGLYFKGKNLNRVQIWKCILPRGRAFVLALSYPVFLEGKKNRTRFSLRTVLWRNRLGILQLEKGVESEEKEQKHLWKPQSCNAIERWIVNPKFVEYS